MKPTLLTNAGMRNILVNSYGIDPDFARYVSEHSLIKKGADYTVEVVRDPYHRARELGTPVVILRDRVIMVTQVKQLPMKRTVQRELRFTQDRYLLFSQECLREEKPKKRPKTGGHSD